MRLLPATRKHLLSILIFSLLLGCATADFRAAEDMVRERKFFNAIELYLSFVRDHPDHRRAAEAFFKVGDIQQRVLNEPESAVATYEKLVSTYPVNDTTLMAQRRLAELQKGHFQNYHRAIIEFEKLIHAHPKGTDAAAYQFEIAQCYTLLRKYDQAAVEYKVLLENYPQFDRLDEAYFHIGNNAYIGGKYTDALEAYETVEKKFPNSPFRVQATFGAGSALEELDDVERAKVKYLAVANDYPSPKVVQIRLQGLVKRFAKKHKTGAPIR